MSKPKLTPEQRAENKKASQAKCRLNKKLLSEQKLNTPGIPDSCPEPEIVSLVSPEIPTQPKTLSPEISYLSPEVSPPERDNRETKRSILEISAIVFPISLCLSITSLLIFFQAEAYSTEKAIKPLDCAVSVICEISLLYLSGTLRRSFASWVLFLSLFTYNLAVMAFAVRREETKKIETEITEDPKETIKREVLKKALVSFDLSAAKKETGNTTKLVSLMRDISTQKVEPSEKPMVELYKIEAFGLIALRAILMLLNALLIHRILKTVRE